MGAELEQRHLEAGLQVQAANALATIAAAQRALADKQAKLNAAEIDKLTRSAERAQRTLDEARAGLQSLKVATPEPWPPVHHAPDDETLQRLFVLRAGGKHQLSWEDCAAALGMAPRTLKRWRWLAAAELSAQGWGWVEIASHPAVEYNHDYLRKDHGKVRLPNGLSFDEHVEQYQAALAERTAQLQAERGAAAAERIYAIGLRMLSNIERLQDNADEQLAHPPATFNPRGAPLLATETLQPLLPFPGQETDIEARPTRRMTAVFGAFMRDYQGGIADLCLKAKALITGNQPESAETTEAGDDSDSQATAARAEELVIEAQAKLLELQRYEREAS